MTYVIPEHAVRAYTALDGTAFQGRMLHLIAGKPKATDDDDAGKNIFIFNDELLNFSCFS